MREDIEGSPLNTWSGEFSLAITDCQKYLQVNFETVRASNLLTCDHRVAL